MRTVAARPIGTFPAEMPFLVASFIRFIAWCIVFSLTLALFATLAMHTVEGDGSECLTQAFADQVFPAA